MPHLFSSFVGHGSEDALQEMDHDRPHKPPRRRPSLLKNLGSLLKRHHEQPQQQQQQDVEPAPQTAPPEQCSPSADYFGPTRRRSLQDSNTSTRRVIPSLPRPQTFRRQESERRERLLEVEPSPTEKRALSAGRQRGLSASAARRSKSPVSIPFPSLSAPDVNPPGQEQSHELPNNQQQQPTAQKPLRGVPSDLPPLQIPDNDDAPPELEDEEDEHEIDQTSLREEYDRRWILNLSMHFRDKSNREKFFVTFAEKPNKWRRVTISLDYRDAPEDSLEADLSTLHYQRDKSFKIYEAIRESLPEIQYYDTVTNLKLETTRADGQLHVHVREDANEIIQYPAISLFQHIQTRRYRESQLDFISHLSGFVYKVLANGTLVIKKEIPGPDTVDEFLYEVNALDSLLGCDNVVQLEGLVTDDSGSSVKALLISYASQGSLVDMLYDYRGTPELPWHRREKWAKQIVQGLADIHEVGFVQGDFTLSNIVIDAEDNAIIIDINRRGCPVGWEPPELGRLIDSGQRIGMHIGVKTDLYQLGMVLWALAEEVDEPEREERPLPRLTDRVPSYFARMVETCLCQRPQGRIEAKKLLQSFPTSAGRAPSSSAHRSVDFTHHDQALHDSISSHRSDKEYIDPRMAVTLEEVRRRHPNTNNHNHHHTTNHSPNPDNNMNMTSLEEDFTSRQVTYVDPDSQPASTSYRFESSGSWVIGERRGRSPVSSRRRRSSPYGRTASSATSLSSESPARRVQRGPICDEGRSAAGEEESGARYADEISDEDLGGVAGAGPDALRNLIEETEESQPPPIVEVADKRLQVLRTTGEPAQLLHTDSGFDELMVEVEDSKPDEWKTVGMGGALLQDAVPDHGQGTSRSSTADDDTAGVLSGGFTVRSFSTTNHDHDHDDDESRQI